MPRLQGIDAPELGQPFGRVARDRLAELVKGHDVRVSSRAKDRYGRVLAELELEHREIGRTLVAEGMAWHYTRFSRDPALAAAEREARAGRRGLWADPAPVPPWEWRATANDRRAAPATR